jgi:hydrogenase/urease accessory protein HupE
MRINLNKPLFLLGLILSPALAHAHTAGTAVNGWHHGFNHPLEGWDHLVTMLAVGIWAAQLHGRAVWLLPLAFVGVMSLGGLAGVAGVSVPGAEMTILLSVVVFGVLVLRKVRFRARFSVLIVGFFAFFHGFAHGLEMPASASLLSFALGFTVATLLLHGAGIVTARLAALAFACLLGSSADAQQSTNAPAAKPEPEPQPMEEETVLLPEIVVTGRSDSEVGIADSASQGNVGQEQLELRPSSVPAKCSKPSPASSCRSTAAKGRPISIICAASISTTARIS